MPRAAGMLGTFCATALLAIASEAVAFRVPTSPAQLAGVSDAIALVTIEEVQDDGLHMRVDTCVSGACTGVEILTVPQPERLSTEPRWTAYAEDQTLLLFLERMGETWRVAGTGADGELPVDGGFVYFEGHFIEGLALERNEVFGGLLIAPRYNRTQVLDALAGYDGCFAWQQAPNSLQFTVTVLCDDREFADYTGKSLIHAFLAAATAPFIQN